jgi:hypothetical protein
MRNIYQSQYDEGEEEFLQFIQRIVDQALEPYAWEIHGHWNASTIHENLLLSYRRFIQLEGRGFSTGESPRENPYECDQGITQISRHLARVISEEIFHHYAQYGKEPIYVLDFQIFSPDIENKFLAIRQKLFCF